MEPTEPIEKLLPTAAEVTPKKLLRICQRFADKLAGGQWFNSESRDVEMSRSFTDVIGRQTKVSIQGMPVSEIRMRTEVNFMGGKEVLDDGPAGLLLEESYQIGAKVRTTVVHAELPPHVAALFSEIFETEREDGDDEEDDQDYIPSVNDDMFGDRYLEREKELGYFIDDDGEVADYYLAERFYVDGELVDEAVYSQASAFDRTKFEPTAVIDNRVIEWQKVHPRQLSEEDVNELLNSFELVIQSLHDAEKFDTIIEADTSPEADHRRRAKAMIAMARKALL